MGLTKVHLFGLVVSSSEIGPTAIIKPFMLRSARTLTRGLPWSTTCTPPKDSKTIRGTKVEDGVWTLFGVLTTNASALPFQTADCHGIIRKVDWAQLRLRIVDQEVARVL